MAQNAWSAAVTAACALVALAACSGGGGGGGVSDPSGVSPPPPPSAPPVPTAGVDNPALGLNLFLLDEQSTALPLIDHFKAGRPWAAPGVTFAQMDTDTAGWVRTLPAPLGLPLTIETVLFDVGGAYPAGRYIVTYDGEGTLFATGDGARVDAESGPGRLVLDVATPTSSGITVKISATDPNGTGDYIRNITVVHEDQEALLAAGGVFNPDFVARVQDFRAVRFMDWGRTNGSPLMVWADRPEMHDAFWSRQGVPYEAMLQLANETGADPWIALPHQADDAYITAFTTLARDTLDPTRVLYLEMSNEVWNTQFPQNAYAVAQANAMWDADPSDGIDVPGAALQWLGMRTAEASDIVDTVYGADADRVRVVLSVQPQPNGDEVFALEAPNWLAGAGAPPWTRIDAYSVSSYFGFIGAAALADDIRAWTQEPDGGFATALTELADGSILAPFNTVPVTNALETAEYHALQAQTYGLEMISYEAGQHVVGLADSVSNDADLNAFFIALVRRDEFETIYTDHFSGWRDRGGRLLMHYADISRPARFGSWGLLADLEDDTGRWRAARDTNADGAWWNDPRASNAFANGAYVVGRASDEIIIGGPGRDVIIPGGARDIDGGDGFDTLALPKLSSDYTFSGDASSAQLTDTQTSVVITLTSVERLRFADGATATF